MGSEPDLPAQTWDFFEGLFDRSGLLTPEGREAGKLALSILRRIVRPDLSAFVAKKELPPEIGASSFHIEAYARLLEFAFRLEMFDGELCRGLRKDLRTNPTGRGWQHANLQLEVAALAAAQGCTVSLEPALLSGKRAVLLLERSGLEVVVETTVLYRDEASLQLERYADRISQRLRRVDLRLGIRTRAYVNARMNDDTTAYWLDRIETTAARLGETDVVVEADGALAILSRTPPKAGETVFNGPVIEVNEWDRVGPMLRKKFKQMTTASTAWLRAEVRSGLWQLSDWARKPLVEKLADIAPAIRAECTQYPHVGGVVASSGLAVPQGLVENETVVLDEGAVMMRRLVPPSRARETVIVPVAAGSPAALLFTDMYDLEPEWLNTAFQERGLPPIELLRVR